MKTMHFLLRCSLGLALAGCVFAQVKPNPGGGGAGGGGNPTGPGGTRTNNPAPPGFPNTTTSPDFSTRPLYLSGKVAMEDGTPPPDTVMMQLVCRSTPHSIGRTDSKGSFSIDLNNRTAMLTMADASETGATSYGGAGPIGAPTNGTSASIASLNGSPSPQGFMGRDLMGCDLQAALAGFRSDIVHLGARRSLDDPNVGVLILHRLNNVEGTTISATSALAPKDAKKALQKGQNALKKGKWEEAQKEFQKAVDIYPKYATAWWELGRVQEHQKDLDGARKSYAMSAEADSKFVNPYLEIAAIAAQQHNWQEVSDQTHKVLQLNPLDFPQAYYLNSLSNYYLKHLDLAEKSAREGLTHDAEHHFPKMNEVLGVLLAQRQDYAGAAAQLRQYLHYVPNGPDAELAKKQLAVYEKEAASK